MKLSHLLAACALVFTCSALAATPSPEKAIDGAPVAMELPSIADFLAEHASPEFAAGTLTDAAVVYEDIPVWVPGFGIIWVHMCFTNFPPPPKDG